MNGESEKSLHLLCIEMKAVREILRSVDSGPLHGSPSVNYWNGILAANSFNFLNILQCSEEAAVTERAEKVSKSAVYLSLVRSSPLPLGLFASSRASSQIGGGVIKTIGIEGRLYENEM